MNKLIKFLSVGFLALGFVFISVPSKTEAFTVTYGNLGNYGTGYAANTSGYGSSYGGYSTGYGSGYPVSTGYGYGSSTFGMGMNTGFGMNNGFGMGNGFGYTNGMYSPGFNYSMTGGPSPMQGFGYYNNAIVNQPGFGGFGGYGGYGMSNTSGFGFGSNTFGFGSRF